MMNLQETSGIKGQRIKYFDTTKGILMLFLIYGHLIIFARSLNIENGYAQYIQNTVPFYRAFFMQTFFFITGFGTSWNIDFGKFLKRNLKTIILPAFIFLPFDYLAKGIITSDFGFQSFTYLAVKYVVEGIPWFLAALFIAKMLYYFINKYFRIKAQIVVLIILFALGVCASVVFFWDNPWCYQQALLMIPFLGLGQVIKNSKATGLLGNKYLLFASIPYFILILFWHLRGMGIGYPGVDGIIGIKLVTAPFYLVFAFSGSALILLLSKFVSNLNVLNLMGRQSLFIYMTHAFVAIAIMGSVKIYYPPVVHSIIFFPAVYILTILIMIAGCKLMENRHFRWMVGKF